MQTPILSGSRSPHDHEWPDLHGSAIGLKHSASAHDNRDSGLRLKSIGARAFGGKRVPFPNNPTSCIGSVCQEPTNYLYCDHGYADWRIPENAREYPFVFTHGAGTRAYESFSIRSNLVDPCTWGSTLIAEDLRWGFGLEGSGEKREGEVGKRSFPIEER